jgi:3-dehydroquinate dehydratase / shikimate dehydrogenase
MIEEVPDGIANESSSQISHEPSTQISREDSAQISSPKSAVRICVPVCEQTISSARAACKRAAQSGDIVELRLDYLHDINVSEISELAGSLRKLNRPVILTFRASEEGGQRETDPTARVQFWNEAAAVCRQELFDIELNLLRTAGDEIAGLDWQRVICSHHDFDGVPRNLLEVYEAMARTLARFLKIAVTAHDTIECLPIFQLLERAQTEGREVIAIAMGQPGLVTRVVGPAWGSYLTYGPADDEKATAPGQVTASKLRDLYRIDEITRDTQVMGLIGSPVAHSISPNVHNAAFATARLNAVYLPFEVRDLHSFIRRMAHPQTRELDWNLRGLSVTAPHKTAVIEFLDWIHPAAHEIGAVNTIVIDREGLRGYNTDALAVLKPVLERVGSLRDTRCAVVGAGGAAKATLWSLKNEAARVTLFARNSQKGSDLANSFNAEFRSLEDATFQDFDLVINATPLGTKGSRENETVAVAEQLHGTRLAYDLVYNPSETLFMQEAREAGCETIGGLSMLVLQGVEQFKLWTGLEAPVSEMRHAAEEALKSP